MYLYPIAEVLVEPQSPQDVLQPSQGVPQQSQVVHQASQVGPEPSQKASSPMPGVYKTTPVVVPENGMLCLFITYIVSY